jgi:hypothetical protein
MDDALAVVVLADATRSSTAVLAGCGSGCRGDESRIGSAAELGL